jgi:hypothetical protein
MYLRATQELYHWSYPAMIELLVAAHVVSLCYPSSWPLLKSNTLKLTYGEHGTKGGWTGSEKSTKENKLPVVRPFRN